MENFDIFDGFDDFFDVAIANRIMAIHQIFKDLASVKILRYTVQAKVENSRDFHFRKVQIPTYLMDNYACGYNPRHIRDKQLK